MSEIPDDPQPSNRWRWPVGCGMALAVVVGLLVLLLHAVPAARESARLTQCRNNMKSVMLAFHNYHDNFRSFPFASPQGTDGTSVHSWRVSLQPYMASSRFYNDYRFDELWNSDSNRKLAEEHRGLAWYLACPSCQVGTPLKSTNYVVVCGPETAFPDGNAVSLSEITDGPENTILVVEIDHPQIDWTEPRDLRIDDMSFVINDPLRPSLSSAHPGGVMVGFADGAVFQLDPSIRPETLQALLTIAGGEEVTREELIVEDKDSSRLLGEPGAAETR